MESQRLGIVQYSYIIPKQKTLKEGHLGWTFPVVYPCLNWITYEVILSFAFSAFYNLTWKKKRKMGWWPLGEKDNWGKAFFFFIKSEKEMITCIWIKVKNHLFFFFFQFIRKCITSFKLIEDIYMRKLIFKISFQLTYLRTLFHWVICRYFYTFCNFLCL